MLLAFFPSIRNGAFSSEMFLILTSFVMGAKSTDHVLSVCMYVIDPNI